MTGMMDLEAMKKRARNARADNPFSPERRECADDVLALVAEVERLREEYDIDMCVAREDQLKRERDEAEAMLKANMDATMGIQRERDEARAKIEAALAIATSLAVTHPHFGKSLVEALTDGRE